jgi:hypothetical protein
MSRRLFAFTLAAVVAGCAQGGPGAPNQDDLRAAFETRARQVAEAWSASTASGAWRTGFVPLQDLTVPPAGFGTDEAKQAFLAGWYELRTDLPATRPADGRIHQPDESVLTVPLISAREAYAALDQGDPPPCPSPPPPPPPSPAGPDTSVGSPVQGCTALVVTAAKLDRTMIRTSQGQVAVPAWLFTVDGLAEPVARVAVAPSAIGKLPTVDVPEFEYRSGLVTAQDLVRVEGRELTFRLGVGACDENIQPLVYETPDAVLVAGTVTTTGGVCIDLLKLEPVTVTLDEPLGPRAVLDALNARPLVLTER